MKFYFHKIFYALLFFMFGIAFFFVTIHLYAKEQAKASLYLAYRYYDKQEYEEAIALLHQAIVKDPDNYAPFQLLGKLYMERGHNKLALRMYKSALEKITDDKKMTYDKKLIEESIKELLKEKT